MDGWSSHESEESQAIVVNRRMGVGRRRIPTSSLRWVIITVVVLVVVGLGVGGYLYANRPTGLAAVPNPTVVTPGGFRASIGANNTITVGLEIRNVANIAITIVAARVVAPPGLTSVALAVVPTGTDNEGFKLEGDLPSPAPVKLGADEADRNAIVAARFTVDCAGLLGPTTPTGTASRAPVVVPSAGPDGEQIFVTVQVGSEQRVEELTPPVVNDVPWLTATAHRVCLDPLPTTTGPPPLPPLPDQSVGPGATAGG